MNPGNPGQPSPYPNPEAPGPTPAQPNPNEMPNAMPNQANTGQPAPPATEQVTPSQAMKAEGHGDPKELIGWTMHRRYKITKVLGSGSFGVCFEGVNVDDGKRVAMKVAHEATCKDNRDMIDIELAAHQIMNNTKGIPKLYDHFVERYRDWEKHEPVERYVIVIELLGPDLSKLFHELNKKFTWKTIFTMGHEMLIRLRSVHEKGLVHRDLKPENFLVGLEGKDRSKIYLTDFGLAKRYCDEKDQKHFPPQRTNGLAGTVRYVSVNVHEGWAMTRRDDLESVAYILMYFIAGSLPWDGWETTKDDHFWSQVKVKKAALPKQQFLTTMPEVIQKFFGYCRKMAYEENPDYEYWLKQFENQSQAYNFTWDYRYDWLEPRGQIGQQAVPQVAAPQAMPQALPQAPPQGSPQAMPQVAPQGIPQAMPQTGQQPQQGTPGGQQTGQYF